MRGMYRKRRLVTTFIIALAIITAGFLQGDFQFPSPPPQTPAPLAKPQDGQQLAVTELDFLAVKGRAPKTGYERSQFGEGWRKNGECDTRNDILARDLENPVVQNCKVISGTLDDPYTGKRLPFVRGFETSDDIQIDHIVALSDAWQKGAQALSFERRIEFANDPLELLAVDGAANQNKSDGDAATWLPPNKDFRCRYVARQIAIKKKYSLWVTLAEKNAMQNVLSKCPTQVLPIQQ